MSITSRLLKINRNGIILLSGTANEKTTAIETLLEHHLSSKAIAGFISLGDSPYANAEYLFAAVDHPEQAIKMAYALLRFTSLLIVDWAQLSSIPNDVEFYFVLRKIQRLSIQRKKLVIFFFQKPRYPNVRTTKLWANVILHINKK